MAAEKKNDIPDLAKDAVLVSSESVKLESETVLGYDFNQGLDYEKMFKTFVRTGFQATNIGRAIEEVNRMIKWRLSDEPIAENEDEDLKDPEVRKNIRCTIFFSYTSNLISSGMREYIRYLAQHKMIDCIVTTAGGVEEDFIKCMAPTHLGAFEMKGAELRKGGINRIGNLLVPNDNYCKFEDWMMPLLDQMLKEQKEEGITWNPSTFIHRLGKEINNEDSVYYWCYKNDIPVFCPAITDGSIGDMIYFHSYKNPGFVMDIASDIRRINDIALKAKHSGMIILGGGIVKHHVCNANLMRNGADFSVFVNVANEFDGSDSGARPDEAISWGKIKMTAQPVKVYAESTTVWPIIMGETFVRNKDKAARAQEESMTTQV